MNEYLIVLNSRGAGNKAFLRNAKDVLRVHKPSIFSCCGA